MPPGKGRHAIHGWRPHLAKPESAVVGLSVVKKIVDAHHREISVESEVRKDLSHMPLNGEINERFGVYKTLCCGCEIVIREEATFPVCPNHPKLSTIWEPVDFEMIPIIQIKRKPESDLPPDHRLPHRKPSGSGP